MGGNSSTGLLASSESFPDERRAVAAAAAFAGAGPLATTPPPPLAASGFASPSSRVGDATAAGAGAGGLSGLTCVFGSKELPQRLLLGTVSSMPPFSPWRSIFLAPGRDARAARAGRLGEEKKILATGTAAGTATGPVLPRAPPAPGDSDLFTMYGLVRLLPHPTNERGRQRAKQQQQQSTKAKQLKKHPRTAVKDVSVVGATE